MELTDAMNQMYLPEIYRTFQPNTNECIFLLAPPPQAFSKIDHLLSHKASLYKNNKFEITELHPIRQPQIKAGFQQWQKQKKTYKLMEIEQL